MSNVTLHAFEGMAPAKGLHPGPASELAATVPVFTRETRLLVVSPHPDDESLATGNLIQLVRAAGGTVDVLMLTDGDNNPWPQRWMERRIVIDDAARLRWGARRRGEVLAALARLDVGQAHLHALGWHDLDVTPRLLGDTAAAVGDIAAVIARTAPNLIALPALGDRHPDHGAAHVLGRLALARSGVDARLIAYMVHGCVADDTPVFDLAVGEGVQRGKREAVLEHHTQTSLSRGRMLRWVERLETFGAPEPARRALPWAPSLAYRATTRVSAVTATGTWTWAWRDAPLARTTDGGWVLDLPRGEARCFVKLWMPLRSPWIFDHWGWIEQALPEGA